jgi:hypothetical protein
MQNFFMFNVTKRIFKVTPGRDRGNEMGVGGCEVILLGANLRYHMTFCSATEEKQQVRQFYSALH